MNLRRNIYKEVDKLIEQFNTCNPKTILESLPYVSTYKIVKNNYVLGLYFYSSDFEKVVGITEDLEPEDEMYSYAHESGHCVLKHKTNSTLLAGININNDSRSEYEADIFATYLFMRYYNLTTYEALESFKVPVNMINNIKIILEEKFY